MARANYHERRNELARQAGFSSYYEMRNARAKQVGYAKGYSEQRAARAAGTPSPRDAPARPQITRAGDAVFVETTKYGRGLRVIESQVKRAPEGSKATVHVELQMADGTTREAEIFRKGGWDTEQLGQAIENFGGIDALMADYMEADESGDMLYTTAPNGPGALVVGMAIRVAIF